MRGRVVKVALSCLVIVAMAFGGAAATSGGSSDSSHWGNIKLGSIAVNCSQVAGAYNGSQLYTYHDCQKIMKLSSTGSKMGYIESPSCIYGAGTYYTRKHAGLCTSAEKNSL